MTWRVALVFGVLAWILRKLDLPPVPILLGLVLGSMTETNFRRALLISNGRPQHFPPEHLLQDLPGAHRRCAWPPSSAAS